MPNLHRGEIEAFLDGRPYRLCLTLGALAELEATFGDSDMLALAERFTGGRLSARDAVRIIGAGLRGAGCDIADAAVARMQGEGGAAGFVDVVARLLAATFGSAATPSLIGAGTDCIGLVRGIWRTLYGTEPEPIPGYTRDWAEAGGEEPLLAAAGRHMAPVPRDRAQPGDVLVFRYRAHAVAKHTGILATSGTFVHAAEGAPVAEVALSGWWRRRIVGVYSFPGLED